MAKKLSGLTNLGKKTLKRGKSIVKKGNTLLKRNFGKRGTVKLKAQKGLSQIRGKKILGGVDEKVKPLTKDTKVGPRSKISKIVKNITNNIQHIYTKGYKKYSKKYTKICKNVFRMED